jgi:hypothetical protein
MSLTDDRADPRKWRFPDVPQAVLPGKGFLVLFADGDSRDPATQDPAHLHLSFTLRSSGPGDVFLIDAVERGACVIDALHYDFTTVAPELSIGRLPDGTGVPVVLPFPTPGGPNGGGGFIRGDATGNGRVNVSDMAWLAHILNFDLPEPACQKALDVNDDGKVDLDDVLYLGRWLFLGGPSIPPPFPGRGPDPTPDDLPCT